MLPYSNICAYFFFNDTATPEIYTLSPHDALPICPIGVHLRSSAVPIRIALATALIALSTVASAMRMGDRKSTRLNSSHVSISYAVFCLKKKNSHTGERLLVQQSGFTIDIHHKPPL